MHNEQVARVAAMLFEGLRELHTMGDWELEMLYCASLLHDIGITINYTGHHKHSRRMIMQADLPTFTAREREIIANVARYHRKAKPSQKHRPFRLLEADDRQTVARLASILRIADGLDRAHENAVARIEADQASPVLWRIGIFGGGDLSYAVWAGQRKAGLLEELFKVRVCIEARGCETPATGEEEKWEDS
jgi:exopolyphosphatase/guanosine-5'-triphosphate,3'-diphosphate pyrophosphatase